MIGNVLVWIIFGALAGWIASMVLRTEERIDGIEVTDIAIGVLGALIGGVILQTVAGNGADGLNIAGLLVAIFGAAVLIGLYKTFHPQS